jgi:hypothetical protein
VQTIHPRRIMTLVLGGVLLYSAGIQELFSQASESVFRSMDSRELTVTGRLAVIPGTNCRSHKTPMWVLRADDACYRLEGPVPPDVLAGNHVRINGVLHETTGILDLRRIARIGGSARPPVDRITTAP